MPIIVPPLLHIVTDGALTAPKMSKDPLRQILENTNHGWRYFSPYLVNVAWLTPAGCTTDQLYRLPTRPSADGLLYTFRHLVRIGAASGNMTITVDEWVGGAWVNVHTTAALATTLNTEFDHTHTATLSATATEIRVQYAHGANPYTPDSLIVYPTPAAPAVGIKASGFIPFEDGILQSAGAPITTEHINRARESALALLLDRKQCVLALVQESRLARHQAPSAGFASNTTPVLIGKGRATLLGQANPVITVYAIASVSAGSTAEVVWVRQKGGAQVKLAATDLVVSGTLELKPDVDGSVEFEVYVRATAGNTAHLKACVGLWTPGQ